MDSDPLRHLEYFSMPNSQTVNPVDQPFLDVSTAQNPSVWDTAGLGVETAGLSLSPSAPPSLSMESIAQPSPLTGLTSLSPNPSATAGASLHGHHGRPVLPARAPRSRDRHERKRSRLSIDSTPLDSVDYWIDFDKDEPLPRIPEDAEPPRRDAKGKASMKRRPTNTTHGSTALKAEDSMDDSALDNALSDDEDGFSSINLADHLSRIESQPPQDVPPREGLYSTPLSWERPQPGIRMDFGINSPALNEAEQRRLIAIAMNPGPSMGGLGSNINLNFTGLAGMSVPFGAGVGFGSYNMGIPGSKPVSPPHLSASQSRASGSTSTNLPKRQGSMSTSNDKTKEKSKPVPGDRTAHNDIERKYRTNLKDKIAELKDAVPALRTISEEGEEDDGGQPSKTPKVSKGTVLTKATEYIHYLERRNKQIVQQHRELSRRLQAFEQLLSASAQTQYTMPTYSRTLFDPRGFC
ncbi:helix-loop-helix DNA-binding domain-containing protein [Cladorrhinum samala]|uniref:Helix-loop-helix DNA-binding domain-containing protein n=1 Tax=Cladorrhinum samala TaxID=585594 RepID=A0AAV9HP46_9PEZI|nr:helix-loop-helix DNA-binding domain-containing protein [Cladorrhinum samala]